MLKIKQRKKQNEKIAFISIVTFSCWLLGYKSFERMYYLLGLGIDYKDGQYEIYSQVVAFTNIAKSEQPNPEATQRKLGLPKERHLMKHFLIYIKRWMSASF